MLVSSSSRGRGSLAPEHHVLGELSKPSEISPVRFPPRSEAAIIFSLVVSEGCVNLVEAALCQSDRLNHRQRAAVTAQHNPALADFRLEASDRCPACRGLRAHQHKAGEFIGKRGAVAELKLLVGCRMALITTGGRR